MVQTWQPCKNYTFLLSQPKSLWTNANQIYLVEKLIHWWGEDVGHSLCFSNQNAGEAHFIMSNLIIRLLLQFNCSIWALLELTACFPLLSTCYSTILTIFPHMTASSEMQSVVVVVVVVVVLLLLPVLVHLIYTFFDLEKVFLRQKPFLPFYSSLGQALSINPSRNLTQAQW